MGRLRNRLRGGIRQRIFGMLLITIILIIAFADYFVYEFRQNEIVFAEMAGASASSA